MRKLLARVLFICLLIPFGSYAQYASFKRINVRDGLPHSTVNHFVQDSVGFIWIATDNGLARYDNHNFHVYSNNYENGRGLGNNQALFTYKDWEETLWIGTAFSIERYDEKIDQFTSYRVKSFYNGYFLPVLSIVQESDSTYLLGTDGGGLMRFNKRSEQFEKLFSKKDMKRIGMSISSIMTDHLGRLWITSRERGSFVLDESLHIIHQIGTQKESKGVTGYSKTLIYNENEMLLASYGGGVQFVDIRSFETRDLSYCNPSDMQSMQVFDVLLNGAELYIGTDGGGLYVYDTLSKTIAQHVFDAGRLNSIGSNVIRSIYLDKEKNLWLGHYQSGVSIIHNKKKFKSVPALAGGKYSLSHANVSAIFVDGEDIWVGTDGGGLNIIVGDQICNEVNGDINRMVLSKKLPSKILCIKKDSRGLIWVGTYLEGAYVYNPKDKTLRNVEEVYDVKLSSQDVRSIYEDRNNRMWLGTNGGGVNIIDIDTETNEILRHDEENIGNSLSVDWVRYIEEDSYGFVWIGTSYGLNAYDPVKKSFTQYIGQSNDSTALLNSFITYIYEDRAKDLWIGTGEGLYLFLRGSSTFKKYSPKDGLASGIVAAITEDEKSNLWVSTNHGLSMKDQKDVFTNYYIDDGLINSSFVESAVFTKEEKIYFGTNNGLIYFNPDEIEDTYPESPVIITGVKIFNQDIRPGEEFNGRIVYDQQLHYVPQVEVMKEENVLTFDLSALTYSYPDKVQIQYRLVGFDEKWTKLKEGNAVTYTNLLTGDYVLSARVSNLGKDQPVSSLNIKVLPPYYETWWFRSGLGLVILTIVYLLAKSRYDKIKSEKDFIEKKYELERVKSDQDQVNYERLKWDSDKKQREAEMNLKNSELISTTLLITNKNEIMNQVKDEIHSFSKSIVSSEVKVGVEKLLKTIDSGFKMEDDWVRFEQHFDDVHKDFFKRLKEKYPDLSITYLKLIAYLRLDLSTKEVASLLNISVRGVEKSRYRLRKKLDLKAGEQLSEVIAQI
ncbi:MAG: hypothetical protein OCD76_06250 [Reichenbachiella sp.]